MQTLLVVLSTVLAISVSQPSSQSCETLRSSQWLLGDWIADDGRTVTVESWKQVSPLTFEGLGETRLKLSGELRSSEALRLTEMSGALFYIAKPEQNAIPVGFKLTRCSGSIAVFENPAHDFPKKLEYQLLGANRMQVTVSGEAGQAFSLDFLRRDSMTSERAAVDFATSAAVLAVADSALRAINAGDFAAFADLMLPEAQIYSTRLRNGQLQHRMRTAAQERATQSTDAIVERGFDAEVHVSGPVALVWMPYDLYVAGKWSHCGVDVFTMVRVGANWRISNLTYSVEQPPACRPHPSGPPPGMKAP